MQTLELPHSLPGLRHKSIELYKQAMRQKDRLKKIGESNSKMMDGIIETSEIVGAAFAVAYLNGKMGNASQGAPYQIGGFDVDIAAAALLAGAGMFDLMGEKYSRHLFALAGGCAAGWATREGLALGAKSATGGHATAAAPAATATVAASG